jgi:hypothetical protein
MAEVGILIIFVLLLLIARGALKAEELRETQKGKELVEASRLRQLESAESALSAVTNALSVAKETNPEEIARLVALVKKAADTKEGQRWLADTKATLEAISRAQARIETIARNAGNKDAASFAEIIRESSEQLGTKEGQLKYYEGQLKSLGQGAGGRPCWVEPDGTIDYLYDVVLGSDGTIRMRETENPSKGAERAEWPMPSVDAHERLTEGEFLRRTRSLYDYGQRAENKCRFFVVVYDDTGPQQKDVYKSLLKAVEGHFYKKLSDVAAPF